MENKKFVQALLTILPQAIKEELTACLVIPERKISTFKSIETVEDALLVNGLSQSFIVRGDDETMDEYAYRMLKEVVKAINMGWTPNWNDTNQRKYWPYFNLSSGFGFSGSLYSYDYTAATVGSRLCFESDEKSNYAATQFIELYKEFLTISK